MVNGLRYKNNHLELAKIVLELVYMILNIIPRFSWCHRRDLIKSHSIKIVKKKIYQI